MFKLSLLKTIAACFLVTSLLSFGYAQESAYEKMAEELSAEAGQLSSPKIALVPFSYAGSGDQDDGGGTVVSERLTTTIVKLKKFKVIDRQNLEKVLTEQKLQTSGAVDPETAKKIGKVLGVEAIITGTLTNMSRGMVEVNAKLIRTETAEIITVSSAKVEKDWLSKGPAQPQEEEQPYEEPVQKTKPARKIKMDVYTDLFFGSGGKNTADITFQNNAYGIKETDLALDFNGNGRLDPTVKLNKITFNDSTMNTTQNPIGARFSGFGENAWFGGSFDIMYYATQLAKQNTTASYNSGTPSAFSFYVDDYLKVTTLLLDLDILLRYPNNKVQPYIGVGFGFSLNNVSSPYVYGYDSGIWKKGFDQFALGLAVNIPIGVRVQFNKDIGAFIESRSITNTFNFTRNIAGEQDSVSLQSNFIFLGVSFKSK